MEPSAQLVLRKSTSSPAVKLVQTSAERNLLQFRVLQCTVTTVNNSGIGSLLRLRSFLPEPELSCTSITTTATQYRNLGDITLRHCQFNFPQPTPVPPTVKWIRAGDQISRLYGQLRFNIVDSTMLTALRAIADSLQKYFEHWIPERWVEWWTWTRHLLHQRGERSQCNYWQVGVSWGWILAWKSESASWGHIINVLRS